MGNYAPVLHHAQNKENYIDRSNGFYKLPATLMTAIFHQTDSCNEIRLLTFLLGTGEGFGLTEKTVLDRTGLSSSAYHRTIETLAAKGWITVSAAYLTINYDRILPCQGVKS